MQKFVYFYLISFQINMLAVEDIQLDPLKVTHSIHDTVIETKQIEQNVLNQAESLRISIADLISCNSFCDIDLVFKNSATLSVNRFVVSLMIPCLPDDDASDLIILQDYTLEQFLMISGHFFSENETLSVSKDSERCSKNDKLDSAMTENDRQDNFKNVIEDEISLNSVDPRTNNKEFPAYNEYCSNTTTVLEDMEENEEDAEADVDHTTTVILEVDENSEENVSSVSVTVPVFR